MNQIRRNKKNENYKKNLEKRYGLTKASEWKEWGEVNIPIGNPKPLKHEFVTTKRHGIIQSREVYVFEWSKFARNTQKEYHKTKNGINSTRKPKSEYKEFSSKDRRKLHFALKDMKLKERNFPESRKLLIDSIYSNNSAERIMKQQARKAAHEEKIRQLIDTMREKKLLKKQQFQKPEEENAVLLAALAHPKSGDVKVIRLTSGSSPLTSLIL